jgi:hypothetical protein
MAPSSEPPASDDDFLRLLLEHVRRPPPPDARPRGRFDPSPPATAEMIADAESQLGFSLPPLLRRVYAASNGGFGPAGGLYPLGDVDESLVSVHRRFAVSGEWPDRLLLLCEWGCAIWSCLDCRTDEGLVVTSGNVEPFMTTNRRSLRSWLQAWMDGIDLYAEMFEPGSTNTGINPFTKEPIVLRGQGKPRGAPWP